MASSDEFQKDAESAISSTSVETTLVNSDDNAAFNQLRNHVSLGAFALLRNAPLEIVGQDAPPPLRDDRKSGPEAPPPAGEPRKESPDKPPAPSGRPDAPPPAGDRLDAPPAPGSAAAAKLTKEILDRANITLANKLNIDDVPADVQRTFTKIVQQANSDATRTKIETRNDIYKDAFKAAGLPYSERTPQRVKNETLAKHFGMQGKSASEIEDRLNEEVRKKLGVPASYSPQQEIDFLRTKQFLKGVGDLPYNASKHEQIEALRRIP